MRTDPAFMKFTSARDALIAYEKSHTTQTKDQRLNDSEYLTLLSAFKINDKAAAEAHGNWG